MRIAVLHNHPIHYKHLLFQEMKNAGMDFKVFFVAAQSSVRHEPIPLSDDLYSYDIGFHGPYESAKALTRAKFGWTALSRYRPDMVIISGFHVAECWTAWAWACLHRRPKILWYESNEFDYIRVWHTEVLKRLFLRGCDRAHVYGSSNKAYLAKLGLPQQRIAVKRAVVNVAAFSTPRSQKTYSENAPKRLIFVGRLAPEKNISFLLNCLASARRNLPENSVTLTIVGSGPLERELKQESKRLGLNQVVNFTGYCPQNELPATLRSADFFVLPSTREPWGLVSLEAMLCRLPVLISNRCGCAADVVTPETGWTFSPWNNEELIALLSRLPFVTADEITQMGNAAHELAQIYSAKHCANRVCLSLTELAGSIAPQCSDSV